MNSLNKWYVENKHLCSLWNSSDDIEVCLASDVEQLQQDYEQEKQELRDDYEVSQKALHAVDEDRQKWRQRAESAEKRIEELKNLIDEWETKYAEAEQEIENLRAKIADFAGEQELMDDELKELTDDWGTEALKKLHGKLNRLDELEQEIAEKDAALEKEIESSEFWRVRYEEAHEESTQRGEWLGEARDEIERLKEELNAATNNLWGKWEVEKADIKGKNIGLTLERNELRERAESAEKKLKIAMDALNTYLLCENAPKSVSSLGVSTLWVVKIAQQALAEIESQNVPTSEQVSTDCIEGTKENPHECPQSSDILRRIERLEDITKHLADK